MSSLHWISLFSKSSWIKTAATSRLSYELGVNTEKGQWKLGYS